MSQPTTVVPLKFPPLLAKGLGLLPKYPGSLLFATALNLMLSQHLPTDVLHQLAGKRLRVQARDAQLCFDYSWQDGRFHAIAHDGATPDLIIAADLWDFYCLLSRKEDPDTLFFNRRLVLEGDTELGLMVKNSLDALELTPAQAFKQIFSAGR